MKIAVTPFNLTSIKQLSEKGADIFILGMEQFANRLVYSYTEEQLQEATTLVHSLDKEIYIQVNLIIHNDNLETVKSHLEFLKEIDVDGIIFGDLAVYNIAKRLSLHDKLIYNPETLNTNFFDPVFWNKKGIKGIIISKEINLEDITGISKTARLGAIELAITGHGHLNMFHSRRPLIENYFKFNDQEYENYVNSRNLHLVEELRNESYPVFQDNHGTHIFREKKMESYKEINQLQKVLDVFIIDGIFSSTPYLLETVENYHNLLTSFSLETATTLSNKLEDTHDNGFLHKKTVYDKY